MALWSSISLCSIAQVQREVRDIGQALSGGNITKEALIEDKILLAKERIQDDLRNQLPVLFPATTEALIQYGQYMFDRAIEHVNKFVDQTGNANIIQPWVFQQAAQPFFLDTLTQLHMPPRVYFLAAVPDGSSYAGTARNGDFLIDTSNRTPYINRGTLEVPTWDKWDTDLLLDHILNPDALRRPAVAAVIVFILQDAATSFTADWHQTGNVFKEQLDYWCKQYKERMAIAQNLLQIDTSGDGVISEFDWTRPSTGLSWIA